ncbi:hypothetical protein [Litoreibacter roseus]|uniref:Uncharacterized protein n=1 Tax=Litoreibacter roseus TaxID=2601869 RepID=A0A6N6JJN7_9RHOB|nr:hypothetical protein [Litoreibacter roseus]GFE66543.1 hypothetical protein KIN_36170 [Litoreibacter roseus]
MGDGKRDPTGPAPTQFPTKWYFAGNPWLRRPERKRRMAEAARFWIAMQSRACPAAENGVAAAIAGPGGFRSG